MKRAVAIAILLFCFSGYSEAQSERAQPDHMSKPIKRVRHNNTTDHLSKPISRQRKGRQPDHMSKPIKRVQRNNSTDHMSQPISRTSRNNSTDHMTQSISRNGRNNTTDHMTQPIRAKRDRHQPDHFSKRVFPKQRTQGQDAFVTSHRTKRIKPPKQISKSSIRSSSRKTKRSMSTVDGKKRGGGSPGRQLTVVRKTKHRADHRRANKRSTAVRNSDEYGQKSAFKKSGEHKPELGHGWQERKIVPRKEQRLRDRREKPKNKMADAFAMNTKKRSKMMRKQRAKMELDLFQGGVAPGGRYKGARGRLVR